MSSEEEGSAQAAELERWGGGTGDLWKGGTPAYVVK